MSGRVLPARPKVFGNSAAPGLLVLDQEILPNSGQPSAF
jgi:hypothetical protein